VQQIIVVHIFNLINTELLEFDFFTLFSNAITTSAYYLSQYVVTKRKQTP
jgi:hypothetical protein